MTSSQFSLLSGVTVPRSNEKVHDVFRFLMKEMDKEQPAVITETKFLNYRDLDYKSDVIASFLSVKNNRNIQQPIVGLFMDVSEESIISMLAVFKSQAVYVPIDPSCSKERLHHIMHKINISSILTCSCHIEKLKSVVDDIVIYEIESIFKNLETSITNKLSQVESRHELACIIFTSGSKGEPKGVQLSHSNILNRIKWEWRAYPLDTSEKVSAMTSLTFINSITEIFPALLKGMPIVIVPRNIKEIPSLLLKYLKDHGVTRTVMVPTLLKSILSYLNANPDIVRGLKIKLWILSGETLTKATLSKFFRHFPASKIANYYSCTEVSGNVTSIVFDKTLFTELDDIVPIGKPIDNTTIFVVNDKGELIKLGEKGEICVSGLNVTMGYQEHITDKFVPNLFDSRGNECSITYKTGDCGYIKEGILYYTGRLDDQVKISGIRTELAEIENVLQSFVYIDDSAVLFHDPLGSSPLLLAFCVINDENVCTEELRARLKTILPPEVIPKIVRMEELPVSINGKVDKFSLLKQYQDNYDSVKGEKVNEILLIIKDVIGIDIDEALMSKTLYELGGSSLAIVEILIRLEDAGYCLNPIMLNICTLDILGTLEKGTDLCCESDGTDNKFRIEEISEDIEFQVVSSIIGESFTTKNCLDIAAKVKPDDHISILKAIWAVLVKERYSFVVWNQKNEIVGVMINTDFFQEPKVQIPERLLPILLMHEIVENRCREKLEKMGKRWLHNTLLATNPSLTAAENVSLVVFMETKLLEYAKNHGFHGIFTINSSQITQAVCNHMLNYQILEEFDVREYVYNGQKVFANVPVSIIASYKCT